MIRTVGKWVGLAAAAVLVVLGAIWVHGIKPNPDAMEQGKAFADAHNTMMSAMMGPSVVYSGDADADFAMLMIPHHQGAIDASKVELKYGVDPAIRAFAAKVIADQQPQIDQMTAWKQAHQAAPASSAATAEQDAFKAANNKMMNGMMSHGMGHSGKADLDYARMMIPHHQGAVDMSETELKYGVDPDMRRLAQAIITAQQAEIAIMKGWKS